MELPAGFAFEECITESLPVEEYDRAVDFVITPQRIIGQEEVDMATGYLQNKQKLRGIRRMLFAVAAINAFCAIVMGIVSSFIESSLPIYIQSLVVGFLAYLVPILLYSQYGNQITVSVAKERFSLNPVKALPLIIAAVSGVCFQFVMVIINLPMNFILGTSEGYMPTSVYDLIAMIIIIGVMPAFFEEFLFRGIVYGSNGRDKCKGGGFFGCYVWDIPRGYIRLFADPCNGTCACVCTEKNGLALGGNGVPFYE